MKTIYVKIDGIHCNHCVTKITNALLKNKKIRDVTIHKNIAYISYQGNLKTEEIISTITNLDYETNESYISEDLKKVKTNITLKEFIIIAVMILSIILVLNKIFGFNIWNRIPTIDSTVTYGMLIVTGLLTSIHCISMCGALNLIAVTGSKRSVKKPLFYNIGRVLSYTIIGGIVGLIGSVFTISNWITGSIILIAAIIMLFISLSMLGVVDPKLPQFSFKRKKEIKNPFFIGLFNGWMPCGPLQAMELYALSTGSFIAGAISMFLFGIGTVPLMLAVGMVMNLVKGKRRIIINKIASVFILLLSLVMINRGLLAFNIDILKVFKNYGDYTPAVIVDNKQVVEFDLEYNNYQDIIVQEGIPVQMIIHVDKKHLTGCNNELTIKKLNITKKLEVGDNVIEFTPTETETYTYSCWMNMIKNNIKVINDKSYFEEKR